jgi:hypothetical protein
MQRLPWLELAVGVTPLVTILYVTYYALIMNRGMLIIFTTYRTDVKTTQNSNVETSNVDTSSETYA